MVQMITVVCDHEGTDDQDEEPAVVLRAVRTDDRWIDQRTNEPVGNQRQAYDAERGSRPVRGRLVLLQCGVCLAGRSSHRRGLKFERDLDGFAAAGLAEITLSLLLRHFSTDVR